MGGHSAEFPACGKLWVSALILGQQQKVESNSKPGFLYYGRLQKNFTKEQSDYSL
jgi:hypothetical protein